MGLIRKLSSQTISKIAAGEVIDRPAAVVKELIDNSLDAQAHMIRINLQDGGLKKIEVIDDGLGMDQADLEICLDAHTTSKLKMSQDLLGMTTFGFRGEALSSMVAVGQVAVSSRMTSQKMGYKVIKSQNRQQPLQAVGMARGTQVKVESLFAKMPVKRKFFRSHQLELRYVTKVLVNYALASPEVGFQLTHNQKIILDLPLAQNLRQRMRSLLGVEINKHLNWLDHRADFIKVSGFLGQPGLTGRSRQHQYLYVNSRPVVEPSLGRLIKQSYRGLLDPHTYPIYILFLDLPPELVDVNLHPKKETVAFMDNRLVTGVVQQAVEEHLSQQRLNYSQLISPPPGLLVRDQKAAPLTNQVLKKSVQSWQLVVENQQQLKQLHRSYILFTTADALFVIDQHAAHERILFEQFKAEFVSQVSSVTQTQLTSPLSLDLPLTKRQLLDEHREVFAKLGFELELFGPERWVLRAIPAVIDHKRAIQVINQVLDDIDQGIEVSQVDSASYRTIAYLACRSAIKANQALTQEQMKMLLEKLAQTEHNLTCPHGRPIVKQFSWQQVGRWFGRP